MDKIDRIKELVDVLHKASIAYYRDDNPVMSDKQKVSGSISSNTNYLINNDINSISSKNKKAKELKIPIINEEYVIEMLNN